MSPVQNREDWFEEKFSWLKRSFKALLVGLFFALIAAFVKIPWVQTICFLPIFVGFGWFIVVLCFIPILHWKDRYAGQKTKLWGFFLVFETSGWSKIIYWFTHVLKDKNAEGPYSEIP